MENLKYLCNGRAVHVLETLKDGSFLVENAYSHEEDGEILFDESRPEKVDRVFDKAPTEVWDSEVAQIQEQIGSLHAELDAIAEKVQKSKKLEAEVNAKLARFDQLRLLSDYIDGKITHYVIVDYSGIKILKFEDAKVADEYGRLGRDIRLLTLYGNSKGDLQWKLNRYSSPSSTEDFIYPATSYEDAINIAQRVMDEEALSSPSEYYLKSADFLHLHVPDAYRKAVMDRKRSSLVAQIEDFEKKTSVYRNQLSELDKQAS